MFYEKHKIFLYKEDFEKFTEGLREAVTFAGNGELSHLAATGIEQAEAVEEAVAEVAADGFSDVDFEDLGSK